MLYDEMIYWAIVFGVTGGSKKQNGKNKIDQFAYIAK